MKERPILMSTVMVQALTNGSKSETRRIIKFPKQAVANLMEDENFELTRMQDGFKDGSTRPVFAIHDEPNAFSIKCPYGEVGDILWIKETYQWHEGFLGSGWYLHKADGFIEREVCGTIGWEKQMTNKSIHRIEHWKTSLFMPKEACRLYLEITSVHVEQLQDITEDDSIAEGVAHIDPTNIKSGYIDYMNGGSPWMNARNSYFSLWQKLNGADSLETNPWVWIIKFKLIDNPKN